MAAMDVPPKTETFGIRTRPALNRLPLDTQVHILTFLDPKDIIAAVKVCTAYLDEPGIVLIVMIDLQGHFSRRS